MTKIYTYDYDNDYNPAMPVVDIEIGRAMDAASLALKAVVDSDADATIIPASTPLRRYVPAAAAKCG